MSQIRWNTTNGLSVLCGWDRPLQHHFVHVERLIQTPDGPDWETLASSDLMRGTDARGVMATITALGITPPPDLAVLLDDHRLRDAGNEIVDSGVIP